MSIDRKCNFTGGECVIYGYADLVPTGKNLGIKLVNLKIHFDNTTNEVSLLHIARMATRKNQELEEVGSLVFESNRCSNCPIRIR